MSYIWIVGDTHDHEFTQPSWNIWRQAMTKTRLFCNRRDMLGLAAASAAGAFFGPAATARAAANHTRPNVASPQGQKMLASYAKGVEAMLKLSPDNPQNWFRNAFVHLLDCPHGNWWFYVWHRGYLGYFERTIRKLSGDETFALPYWDWTQSPVIPQWMFDGSLTPQATAFASTTENLSVFTAQLKPALTKLWDGLSAAQLDQLKIRGYDKLDMVWNDVTGFNPSIGAGISGNEAFATTCGARYLTKDNPKFDAKTAYNVSPFVVLSGLLPTDFYNASAGPLSFMSSKTSSHNTQPSGATVFSTLEGMPHNKIHNYIGGVGPLDPGPYGNMTNFLSPVDPVFFLHHANMDRLWDVWTRKQQSLNLPYLPSQADLKGFYDEPFLFFVDGDGSYAGAKKAGDFLSMEAFGYDYEPGFGENVVGGSAVAGAGRSPIPSEVRGNVGVVSVPNIAQKKSGANLAARALVAELTLSRPAGPSATREFDVLVNAPDDVSEATADSPYYAGTIAFFGPQMTHMQTSHDATFLVPLKETLHAFSVTANVERVELTVRVVPSHDRRIQPPTLKSLSVHPL